MNQSAGPLSDAREPLRLISIAPSPASCRECGKKHRIRTETTPEIHIMGFNKRKMEAQRAAAAEREAAAKRATEAPKSSRTPPPHRGVE